MQQLQICMEISTMCVWIWGLRVCVCVMICSPFSLLPAALPPASLWISLRSARRPAAHLSGPNPDSCS